LLPRHDLAKDRPAPNVISTYGALNRLPETFPAKVAAGVILIGGPSKHHDWLGAPLLAAIASIVNRQPDLSWTIANSRRTPAGFLDEIRALGLSAQIVPHEETKPDWLPAQLALAREVWVTEDSTSMIFEAITAKARVGLLPMPAKHENDRLIRAVQDVAEAGYATRYADWLIAGSLPSLKDVLHEAARCAEVIIRRFFNHG